MSYEKILDLADAPAEGTGKKIEFKHSYTEFIYELALFQMDGKFYALTNQCKLCEGSLGDGVVVGNKYVACHKDNCQWSIKKGICKFNHSNVTPSYRVYVEEDGLFVKI